MSMEITNNYSNFGRNYTNTAKKTGSDTTAEVKSGTVTSGKDKVQDYYEKLCKKFPQINFNTNGGKLPSNSSKVTVNLSYDCLKKMADDPEFAKEVEWNLSGEVAANSMVYGWAQRDGVVLGGRTVTYDANGNRESSCGGMRTANAGDGNNINKLQKKYKKEEERYLKTRKKKEEREKIAKRREEKRVREEAVAERRAERREDREARLKEEYATSVAGTDIKAVTESVIDMSLSTSVPTGTSLDIKA